MAGNGGHVIWLKVDNDMYRKLLQWCADNFTLADGQRTQITPAWAIKQIINRYFTAQETRAQILRAERSGQV